MVDTPRERILVDTGFGETSPVGRNYPQLQERLRRARITPDSIDVVVLSHGHLGHIGGLLTRHKKGHPGLSEVPRGLR